MESHYHIHTYFGALNTNLTSENLNYPSVLCKSTKNLRSPENRQELRFDFEMRYMTTFMHLGHVIPIYLYLPNMILTSTNIHNPQVLKKSSVKTLKTEKKILCYESDIS